MKGSGVWAQVTEWRAFGQDQRQRDRTRDRETAPQPLRGWRAHTPHGDTASGHGTISGATLGCRGMGHAAPSRPHAVRPGPSQAPQRPLWALSQLGDVSSCAPYFPSDGTRQGRAGRSDRRCPLLLPTASVEGWLEGLGGRPHCAGIWSLTATCRLLSQDPPPASAPSPNEAGTVLG